MFPVVLFCSSLSEASLWKERFDHMAQENGFCIESIGDSVHNTEGFSLSKETLVLLVALHGAIPVCSLLQEHLLASPAASSTR